MMMPTTKVLILDVDGTLYGSSSGVEQQVGGVRKFWKIPPFPMVGVAAQFDSTSTTVVVGILRIIV